MHGYESGLMERPVRCGPEFEKPRAFALRTHKASKPAKVLEPKEIHTLMEGGRGDEGDDSLGHQLRIRQCGLRRTTDQRRYGAGRTRFRDGTCTGWRCESGRSVPLLRIGRFGA
jgi:hypothetical protein